MIPSCGKARCTEGEPRLIDRASGCLGVPIVRAAVDVERAEQPVRLHTATTRTPRGTLSRAKPACSLLFPLPVEGTTSGAESARFHFL